MRRFVHMLAWTVASLSGASLAAELPDARAVTYDIDISAQDLNTALQELAVASHHKLFYRSELVAGKISPALKGELTTEEAMRRLLAGTELTYEITPSAVVLIRERAGHAVQPVSNVAGPDASGLRLAQGDGPDWPRFAQNSADTSTSAEAPQEQYGEVVVSGYRFLNEDTSGTTNLPLPIEEVPQSISLISSDFLKAADIKSMGEVAQYTPGAIFSGAGEGFRTEIKLRGFSAGEAVDGLPLPSSSNEYDYAVVERLEMVKGPSSVVYGTASPGGLVNVVTKKAAVDTAEYLSVTSGMWNTYRVEGQAGGAVDSEGRVSAIGIAAYEQGDSFMRIANHDRTVLYGGLDFRLTDSVKAYARGGFESNARTSFDGIPAFEDGTIAPLPRSFFIGSGEPRFELKTDRIYVNTGADWDVTELWQLSLKGNYTRSKHKGAAPYSGGLQENGEILLSVDEAVRETRDTYTAGISSVYKLDKLGLADSFISLAALHFNSKNDGVYRFFDIGTANVFDGVQAIADVYDTAVFPDDFDDFAYEKSENWVRSYSAQTVLRLLEPLAVLLGASYASTRNEFGSSDVLVGRYKYSGELSYRAGVTYEVASGLNTYLSYSESFQPQTLRDINENPLAPLRGTQKELGVKYAPAGARLLFTAAAFEIVQSNKPEFDQATPTGDRFKAVGEVRHRGAELEIIGQLADRWQVHAGYAYLDPVVTKNLDSPEVVGTTVTYLPKHTASAFTSYEITDRFTVGAGVRHVDSVKTEFDRSTRDLPAYTIVDVTAGYAWNNWQLQLNLHNLLDEKYYINTYETTYYGNIIGEPANISASVRYDF